MDFLFPEKIERRDSLDGKTILILVCGSMLGIMVIISAASHMYNLNGIKSKTVGDGQHGAARFATGQELTRTFRKIPYTPQRWRRLGNKCTELQLPQGVVVGCQTKYKILRDRNSRKRWPFRLRKDTYVSALRWIYSKAICGYNRRGSNQKKGAAEWLREDPMEKDQSEKEKMEGGKEELRLDIERMVNRYNDPFMLRHRENC